MSTEVRRALNHWRTRAVGVPASWRPRSRMIWPGETGDVQIQRKTSRETPNELRDSHDPEEDQTSLISSINPQGRSGGSRDSNDAEGDHSSRTPRRRSSGDRNPLQTPRTTRVKERKRRVSSYKRTAIGKMIMNNALSAPKRRVYFEQTQRVYSIPSRHSITRAEKDGQWYNRSDLQNFARREKVRRENGGVSLDEAPTSEKSPTV